MIRASCCDCGDIQLTVADVRLRRCAHDGRSTYLFRCPSCQCPVVKAAEPRVVDLLTRSGVVVEEWDLPAEMFEPHHGCPISHDDLIDFHDLLDHDDWFDRVAGMSGR